MGCLASILNLIVPGSFRMHFLHRYRRNLYFISVLCSYSTQLSADKTQGSPRVPGQIFRQREVVSIQGPKPQGHFSLTLTFLVFFFFSWLPPSLLHLQSSVSGDRNLHHEPVAEDWVSLNHCTILSTHVEMVGTDRLCIVF